MAGCAKTLVLGTLTAVVCGCGPTAAEDPLTTSEYRRQANAQCAGQRGDLSSLKPPRHLQALHDRATALSHMGNRGEPRELASVYRKLKLVECVRLVTPDPGDPQACRDIVSLVRDALEERRSWADEVRAEEETVKQIEEEIRASPENRAAAEPDLKSSRKLVEEAELEVKQAERDLEQLEAQARDEGCARWALGSGP